MALTELGKKVVSGEMRTSPQTQEDWDYRKSIACELVFAWEDARSKATKEALERVMFNVGVERVDGAWCLVTRSGGYMILSS